MKNKKKDERRIAALKEKIATFQENAEREKITSDVFREKTARIIRILRNL